MMLSFSEYLKLLLRFVGKSPRWHGTITLKFYEGKLSHMTALDSYDLEKMEQNLIIDLTKEQELKKED